MRSSWLSGLVLTILLAGCGGGDDPGGSDAKDPVGESSADAGPAWTASPTATLQTSLEIPEQANYVNAVAFAPDGAQFASGDADGAIRLWDTEGAEQASLEGHEEGVNDLAFSPDGSLLVSASTDGTARLWTLDTGESVVLEGAEEEVRAAIFTPDGETVVTASWDDHVRFYSAADGSLVDSLQSEGSVEGLGISRDGSMLAVGGSNGFLELWSGPEWSRAHFAEGDGSGIGDFAFSPDGETIYGATNNSTVVVWAAGDGAVLETLGDYNNFVSGVELSPDGGVLASGAYNGTVRLHSTETYEVIDDKSNMGGVTDLSFSPTEPLLVTTDGKRIAAYELR